MDPALQALALEPVTRRLLPFGARLRLLQLSTRLRAAALAALKREAAAGRYHLQHLVTSCGRPCLAPWGAAALRTHARVFHRPPACRSVLGIRAAHLQLGSFAVGSLHEVAHGSLGGVCERCTATTLSVALAGAPAAPALADLEAAPPWRPGLLTGLQFAGPFAQGATLLAALPRACPQLRQLRLILSTSTERAAHALGATQALARLEKLELSMRNVSAAAVHAVLAVMPASLRALSLARTAPAGEGLFALLSQRFPALRFLGVLGSGAAWVETQRARFPALRDASFVGCSFQPGVAALLDAPALRRLSVERSGVLTPADCARFPRLARLTGSSVAPESLAAGSALQVLELTLSEPAADPPRVIELPAALRSLSLTLAHDDGGLPLAPPPGLLVLCVVAERSLVDRRQRGTLSRRCAEFFDRAAATCSGLRRVELRVAAPALVDVAVWRSFIALLCASRASLRVVKVATPVVQQLARHGTRQSLMDELVAECPQLQCELDGAGAAQRTQSPPRGATDATIQ